MPVPSVCVALHPCIHCPNPPFHFLTSHYLTLNATSFSLLFSHPHLTPSQLPLFHTSLPSPSLLHNPTHTLLTFPSPPSPPPSFTTFTTHPPTSLPSLLHNSHHTPSHFPSLPSPLPPSQPHLTLPHHTRVCRPDAADVVSPDDPIPQRSLPSWTQRLYLQDPSRVLRQ